MPEIDPITGLPKELGVWDNITKESQKITIKVIKKKFGKKYTVINGINEHEVDIKGVAKKLKSKFACGGTAKQGIVELQGDHTRDIRKELIKLGFAPDSIE
jgi:translation initiation factor 1